MSNSMDNQMPEDNDPPEPNHDAVYEWVGDRGSQMCQEAYMDNRIGLDFVEWTEMYWDDIIQWYIEDTEE